MIQKAQNGAEMKQKTLREDAMTVEPLLIQPKT